jgi:hypothetical protein
MERDGPCTYDLPCVALDDPARSAMHFTREDQLTFLVNDFGQKSHLKLASAVPLELPFP